jgi:hypothetical protein
VVNWATQGQPSYGAFYEGLRAFVGQIVEAEHQFLGFWTTPNWNFGALNVRRDETIPALSRGSGSLPVPPTGPGGYNLTIEWSASWNDFAGLPVDTPTEWAMVFRTTDGSTQTVDITPRRAQAFRVTPGAEYDWRNVDILTEQVVAEGQVTASADGLITVPGFVVSANGNRLVITPRP